MANSAGSIAALVLIAASANARASSAPGDFQFTGASPLQWSERMANAEMERVGDTLSWKPGGVAKWDYATGLFTLALLKLNDRAPHPAYFKFAEDTIGSFITPDGQIRGYKPGEYQLDHLNPGKTLLALYKATGEERYRKAADLLCRQLETQPRTRDGGFWHKQRYPGQMWLDGVYMAGPFEAQYAALFKKPPGAFDDVARQIRLVAAHTYDPATGLFFHGWDETKTQAWANPVTGTSSNLWARGIGWYGMALVDVLDWFPTNHPARREILDTLGKLDAGLLRFQDPQTGLWYQVVDQGSRPGNYWEASASCMFVYVLAKSVNCGYAPASFKSAILPGYKGIIDRLVKEDKQGRTSLARCCAVAGLGYGRDGSYDYYIKERVVDDDLKGVGAFILAGLEMQRLAGDAGPGPRAGQ